MGRLHLPDGAGTQRAPSGPGQLRQLVLEFVPHLSHFAVTCLPTQASNGRFSDEAKAVQANLGASAAALVAAADIGIRTCTHSRKGKRS